MKAIGLKSFPMFVLAFVVGLAAIPAVPAFAADLYAGGFSNVNVRTKGTWRIYEKDGKRFFELSEDFRARSAPDLKVFFNPLPPSEVKNRNATKNAFLLTELKSNRGKQTYEIPADVDLTAYQSVVIHCQRFTKMWAAGALTPVSQPEENSMDDGQQ